jgi:hypothetical protein
MKGKGENCSSPPAGELSRTQSHSVYRECDRKPSFEKTEIDSTLRMESVRKNHLNQVKFKGQSEDSYEPLDCKRHHITIQLRLDYERCERSLWSMNVGIMNATTNARSIVRESTSDVYFKRYTYRCGAPDNSRSRSV